MPLSKQLLTVVAAGSMSASMFLLVASLGPGFYFLGFFGFYMMLVPILPLFMVGLGREPRLCLAAGLMASVLVGSLAASPALGAMFLLVMALPTWSMSAQSLKHRGELWFPLGTILIRLTLCGVVAVALLTAFYATTNETIAAMMARVIHEAFADLSPEYSDMVDTLASQWSFLIFSMTIWLWCIALYCHGWLANRLLKNKNQQIRPDFAVRVFDIPAWMLWLLAICALASLIGGESMRFLGKTSLIALLLPYFFLGTALMHESSKNWTSRRFFLVFIYIALFVQTWPALILAGVGLWHQIKHLPSPAGSPRN